ncbi:type II toxin-antitoxin system HicB family antitoxin [Acidithiobacillus sp. IBUN Pt1247-S3]|uniref:type II toxin-antitoxin system HicB family antitoxin n=1 Tax=Acidithiobacillus sp. IBUN Pt1247-S3 TaxID=3166642 RepID=UPI0034E4AE78
MKNRLEYQGYFGSVEYSAEDDALYGRILNIRDLVTYEGQSVSELKTHFTAAVDGYLRMCAELHQEPDKPASGRFLVRIPPELHRDAQIKAAQENHSLNEIMTQALVKYLHDGHSA